MHWANFICVQNFSVFGETILGLLDECGCEECVKTKEKFTIDYANANRPAEPKFTGPRSGWMDPDTCPCAWCEEARATGEHSKHFAE